jgi:plasmid stabilization system protein ParE
MGKRKVSILEPAATAVAEIAWFIENKGLPQTAKKFVDNVFIFFDKLADERIEHKPCIYRNWKDLGYRCVPYKKKYIIAYLTQEKEIVICDFVSSKLLK